MTTAEEPAFVERTRAAGRPSFAIRQLTPQSGERFVIDLSLDVLEVLLAVFIAYRARRDQGHTTSAL